MRCLCLLALSWVADPAAPYPGQPPSVAATCVRPAIGIVTADSNCAIKCDTAFGSVPTKPWLTRWERATRDVSDRSRSERDEFRRQRKEVFNEHVLAAVEYLTGRVKAAELDQTYTWRMVDQSPQTVSLEGIPRDELEQLFYASVRVTLSSRTGTLEELTIISRNQPPRIAWQPVSPTTENSIELVRFENGVPPSPSAPIRTADVRTD